MHGVPPPWTDSVAGTGVQQDRSEIYFMNKQTYTTRSGVQQYRPVMGEEEYRTVHDAGVGFCLACGEEADSGVEPDARQYPCETCGQRKVYGLEELLLMALVVLKEPEAPGP
jgi:hypothetical protein